MISFTMAPAFTVHMWSGKLPLSGKVAKSITQFPIIVSSTLKIGKEYKTLRVFSLKGFGFYLFSTVQISGDPYILHLQLRQQTSWNTKPSWLCYPDNSTVTWYKLRRSQVRKRSRLTCLTYGDYVWDLLFKLSIGRWLFKEPHLLWESKTKALYLDSAEIPRSILGPKLFELASIDPVLMWERTLQLLYQMEVMRSFTGVYIHFSWVFKGNMLSKARKLMK